MVICLCQKWIRSEVSEQNAKQVFIVGNDSFNAG